MLSQLISRLRSENGRRAFLALLLVASVGIATIGTPIVYGGTTAAAEADSSPVESYDSISAAEDELGPADEIYLGENGSAVLAYEEETDVDQFDVGMDVSEGLAYLLVADDIDDPDEELEEGSFSAVLDDSGLAGDGSLVMERPDDLSELTVDVSGEVTDETNAFEATATGTIENDGAMAGSAASSGHVTATADRLETSGNVVVDTGMGASGTGNLLDVSVAQTNGGYAVDVTEERTVFDWSSDQWETREQAEQTLEAEYGALADELGGTSEITIDHYDFEEQENGQHRLELEFSVEYTGIEDELESQLADELAQSADTDLTRAEAEEVAAGVTALEIETLEFTMDTRGGSIDIEWDVALAEFDEVSLAMIDLLEASEIDDEAVEESIADARTSLEAQQAADMEWTLEWNVKVEQASGGDIQFDAEVTSDTENWGAYVDELEANGVDTGGDVTFELTAETDGDEFVMDAQFEVEAEDLAKTMVDAWAESLQNDQMATSEANEFVTMLSESELEVARVDANIEDGTVQVEGGAKFENMERMADSIGGSAAIGGIASETTNDSATMYVYVEELGDIDTASADKSDVEHLDVVDDETTVHQAGEWDDEFPDVDSTGMAEYLGVELQRSAGETADSESVPGFGASVGLAAIAGLLAVLVLRRRG